MEKVLIVGGFPYNDWVNVIGRMDIEIQSVSVYQFNEEIYNKSYTLVIFACEGKIIHDIFQKNKLIPSFIRFWNDKNIRKVAWSMDSHHQWEIETHYQHFFNTYYLAHSNYMNKFQKTNVRWLPCSLFVDQDRKDLLEYYFLLNVEKQFDVISIYRNYLHIGDRNAVMAEIYKYLHRGGYLVFLGQTQQFLDGQLNMGRYYSALCSGKIVLNVSIKDDLNMRNFEALALNQIMVTNYVPDHDKIDLDYSNTVFFERYNLESFAKAMEEAEEKTKQVRKRTVDSVINKHMLIHRFVEVINHELGTKLAVPDIDVERELTLLKIRMESKSKLGLFSFSKEAGDLRYSASEIGIKAAYAYLLNDNAAKAFEHFYELLTVNQDSKLWKQYLNELFYLNDLLVKRYCDKYQMELLNVALWEAIQLALKEGISQQAAEQLFMLLLHKVNCNNVSVKKIKREFVQILLDKAKKFIEIEKGHEALKMLERVQALGVVDKKFYYLSAEANRLAGNAKQAIFYYEKAIK